MSIQTSQQDRDFGSSDVGGDPENEATSAAAQRGQGLFVSAQKNPGRFQEQRPLRREAHRARRAFDQPVSEPLLQPPQLHADRALGRRQRFGGARETLQVGDGDEGPDGIHIKRLHFNHPVSQSL
ncbi:hypothetical protein D3C85_1503630 [compost metagenome]